MAILENNTNSSRWFDVDVVPQSYTFPEECRPGKSVTENVKRSTFSVIDLSKVDYSSEDKEEIIKQLLKACQEDGIFQVINHGFSEELIKETTRIFKEFYSLPVEEKVYEGNEGGWLYSSSTDVAIHGAHFWREALKHYCHPLEECMQRWPQKPSRYREVVAAYLLAIRKLSSRILELICEGLGLEPEYLKGLNEVQHLTSNFYPPCPDPSVTLGLLRHKDPSFITILHQGNTSGLQVLQNGEWFIVEAICQNAFVVNIGNQMEILSNGKLRSVEHRVVTNAEKSRTTIATFINPSPSYIVQPATALIDKSNPPLFEPITYKDYVSSKQPYGANYTGSWSSYWRTDRVRKNDP